MADVFTREKRSDVMSKIKSENTQPELIVRKFIFSLGLRYRLYQKSLIGKPDIVLQRAKTVVNIHGCFWHGHNNCKFSKIPKSNSAFWINKITKTTVRDTNSKLELEKAGWRVITIWECSLLPNNREKTFAWLRSELLDTEKC